MRTRRDTGRSSRGQPDPHTAPLWPAARTQRATRVVAGVDEAGLGPLLGPLTIGYSAFRVPTDLALEVGDLWPALAEVVDDAPRARSENLVVADSKVVFTRNPRGECRLEATALSFLAQCDGRGDVPGNGAELMRRTPPDVQTLGALEHEAWFAHLPARLPHRVDEATLTRHVERLRAALNRSRIAVTCAGVLVLPVCELNASFAETESKSLTHWRKSAAAFRHLWELHAHEGLDLVVDRHGGRMRYASLLRSAFPDASVEVVSERSARSEYTVTTLAPDGTASRSMRIAFAERAESASFAVAVASCLAKYARETCMHAFNAYFASLQPGLRPTAGYTTDGRRWIADAQSAIERSGMSRDDLVRAR